MGLQAQNWLPDTANAHQEIRLLDCRYHEEKLKSCEQLTDTSSCWKTSVEKTEVADGILFVFRFKALKNLTDAGVAVAFDRYHWTSDNYVMIPASVYNGNRQRIVNRNYATGLDPSDYDRPDLALTSNPIPQLSPDFGSPSRLEVSVCNAATPAIAFLDRQKKEGVLLLTDQGIVRDGQVLDHGLIVEETPDRSVASFVISAPGVREKKPEFIGFSKSPDRGITVREGDEIVICITRLVYPCTDAPCLLGHFMEERKRHIRCAAPRNLVPMSRVLDIMDKNIDLRYYQKTVIYRRTNNPVIEAYKEIFSGGEFGKLALYKQDWLHHYPTWNRWATDPQKNGGPFMDAMLHNLNAARYLMGRRVVGRVFFSDDHTHSLACDDTQFLKVDFEQGASAHLFITWAAELAVYDSAKNDREHIDQCFMVTDQGWLFRNEIREGKAVITATRNGLEKDFPVIPFEETFFDRYAKEIKNRDILPADLPDIREAYEDLRILLEN